MSSKFTFIPSTFRHSTFSHSTLSHFMFSHSTFSHCTLSHLTFGHSTIIYSMFCHFTSFQKSDVQFFDVQSFYVKPFYVQSCSRTSCRVLVQGWGIQGVPRTMKLGYKRAKHFQKPNKRFVCEYSGLRTVINSSLWTRNTVIIRLSFFIVNIA